MVKANCFSYSTVARFWAVIFLIVGLVFLFVPDLVGMFLMLLASKMGLTSYIDTLPGSLWYVLTLSFMAMITVCAWQSGRNPSNRELYYLLLVAKVVSTVGFLALAYYETPAFLLCAVADGFVTLTLWLSGRKV